MMGRFLVLVALSLVLQSVHLVLGDDPDNSIILDDDKFTPKEILFLLKYIGLNPELATKYTDMIMKNSDANGDGVIEQPERKTWV
ncbi:uncharacterized protein LOC110464194 isoform X2 [Mizuhopecten yessoensis]|uniref:EF-hand domain-containing protein n=1 Tax=Mizuhopecten yessoensis TaxID=6573 RepID=A0A210PUI3_MIZYE|nr:uncharacterized protein LOC110464194 isoform X2 [Mizuhopecten yessoensis]OWF40115.1 hypothetical protein KP79_PYT05919 [Mizuhopecten yessoensis]